jgi:hypothetical protein
VIDRQMAKPGPMPPGFVVWKASKTRSTDFRVKARAGIPYGQGFERRSVGTPVKPTAVGPLGPTGLAIF